MTLAADIPCRAPDASRPLGIDVETLWLVVSVATALTALAGLIVAVWMRSARLGADEGRKQEGDGTIRFLSTFGAWSSALFLATIALGATAPLFLGCP